MKASRRLNRRSFVASVIGGAAFGGSATALVTGRAEAQNVRYSGVTDSDTGEHADRPGYGVGTRNRYTDQDTGPNADAQFHGRGPSGRQEGAPSGQATYDPSYAQTNCSDSDTGSYADPGGRGRRCNGQVQGEQRNYTPQNHRTCTDSDTGNGADRGGSGRHC